MIQAGNYITATRQIENLICTNRESLLGSGAWNSEFYTQLQNRPFYHAISTIAVCRNSNTTGSSSKKKKKGYSTGKG